MLRAAEGGRALSECLMACTEKQAVFGECFCVCAEGGGREGEGVKGGRNIYVCGCVCLTCGKRSRICVSV